VENLSDLIDAIGARRREGEPRIVRAIQKITRNGNSMSLTLPRGLMFALNLVPGDFVEIATTGDGAAILRPWSTAENVTPKSPGIIPPRPEPLKP
jgi:virulence-associated protein VagC